MPGRRRGLHHERGRRIDRRGLNRRGSCRLWRLVLREALHQISRSLPRTARLSRRGGLRDALDDRDQDVAHEVGVDVEGGGCSGATPVEIAERISVSALMLFMR